MHIRTYIPKFVWIIYKTPKWKFHVFFHGYTGGFQNGQHCIISTDELRVCSLEYHHKWPLYDQTCSTHCIKKGLRIGSMFDLGPSTLQFTEEYRWTTYFLFFPLFFFGLWFLGTDFSRLVSFFILFSDWIFLGLFTDFDFLGWVAPRGTDARFPSTVFGFRVDGSTCSTSSTSSVARVEVVTTMVVSPSSYVVVSARMKPKDKTMLWTCKIQVSSWTKDSQQYYFIARTMQPIYILLNLWLPATKSCP